MEPGKTLPVTKIKPTSEQDTNMFLIDKLIAAQREASKEVAEGRVYSVELPIVGRVPVPSPRQLAIYAALGGLAAIEIIDWPVAVAMGVGSALVSRKISDLETREEELAEAIQHELADTNGSQSPAKAAPAAVKKAGANKAPAKKAPAKKASAKKTPAKKVAPKKASPR
jgi:cation-transporting ATPase I